MSVEEDNAISDGWLCDRGRYNVGYIKDDRRLTQPLYRQNGEWVQIGWDDAIMLWKTALRDGIAKSGAGSVGAIGGARLLNEEAFLLQHIHRALGVENLDWRSSGQHHAFPGAAGGTHVDLENAECIITFGRSPAELAPVLDLRIRKAVRSKGATLITVGDHAAPRGMRGVRAATFADAVNAVPKNAKRIALVWDGVPSSESAAVKTWSAGLPEGTKLHTYVLGEQPNARGAEAVGMFPRDGAAGTQAMLEAGRDGKLSALSLLGVNPVLHWPDRELAIEALKKTPFVVVSEFFMTETAELATLVLPACSAFEKTGTTTNLAGDVLPVVAGVPAPGEAWADGDMLVALAEALGVQLPAADEIERRIGVLVSQAPAIPEMPEPEKIPPRALVESETLRVIVAANIFSGGGTMAHDTSLGGLRIAPQASIHPRTAAGMKLGRGDVIDVAGPDRGRIEGLAVVLDENVPEGAVVLIEGVPNAPLNALRGAINVHVAAKVHA
jgi:anaerobic selenocysteine-containing dehydrogenase